MVDSQDIMDHHIYVLSLSQITDLIAIHLGFLGLHANQYRPSSSAPPELV